MTPRHCVMGHELRGFVMEAEMTPVEALKNIKTLVDGSDYVTDARAMQTLIETIRVLVEKGLSGPNLGLT
jgi:hypothetical protein